jgi:N-acetylglucosamine-6-sulfatase
MRLRAKFALAALVVAGAVAGCQTDDPGPPLPAVELPPASAKAKNVVVVMTDDQNLEELSNMRRTRALVGDRGAAFEEFFVSYPLCCPSRATYLTGQYAHNNGVLSNSPEFGGGYPSLHGKHALPVFMQEAGYETASIGRYLNFYGVIDPTEVPPGWGEFVSPPGRSAFAMYDYDLNENGSLVHYGGAPADYQTDVFARLASDYIRDQEDSERPFFLSVTPLAPHDESDEVVPGPLDGPRPAPRHASRFRNLRLPTNPAYDERDVSDKPPFVRREPRMSPAEQRWAEGSYRRRARSLLAVDDLVSDLVAALRETGQLKSTYVLFTSDNGFLLGSHRLNGKVVPYEESIHMPLLVRGPGIEPATRVEGLAANVDLAPTILDMAGARSDLRRFDGISLLPALTGEKDLPSRPILLENLGEEGVPDEPRYVGLRTQRWSYVDYETSAPELYDMARDPFQLENLAGRSQLKEVRDRLRSRLAALEDCEGPTCR